MGIVLSKLKSCFGNTLSTPSNLSIPLQLNANISQPAIHATTVQPNRPLSQEHKPTTPAGQQAMLVFPGQIFFVCLSVKLMRSYLY
jgi:hypothetical protein